jgi:hypothetical protein
MKETIIKNVLGIGFIKKHYTVQKRRNCDIVVIVPYVTKNGWIKIFATSRKYTTMLEKTVYKPISLTKEDRKYYPQINYTKKGWLIIKKNHGKINQKQKKIKKQTIRENGGINLNVLFHLHPVVFQQEFTLYKTSTFNHYFIEIHKNHDNINNGYYLNVYNNIKNTHYIIIYEMDNKQEPWFKKNGPTTEYVRNNILNKFKGKIIKDVEDMKQMKQIIKENIPDTMVFETFIEYKRFYYDKHNKCIQTILKEYNNWLCDKNGHFKNYISNALENDNEDIIILNNIDCWENSKK